MEKRKLSGNILVVDDDPVSLNSLSEFLTRRGYFVSAAKSGKEALSIAHSSMPDLILLDIILPDITGYEVCSILKKDNETAGIPVLFLSSLNETKDKIKGFEAGGLDFITKPYVEEEILACLQTHIQLSHFRTELFNKTSELLEINLQLEKEIKERKRVEGETKQLNSEMEQRFIERTAQLEAANKELEAFSYSVSHDLRVPLRAIEGFTRIFLEDYSQQIDNEGKKICNIIIENTRRMGQLIENLLLFSRLSRAEIKLDEIKMEVLVISVFNEITTVELREKIKFDVGEITDSQGDPSLIKQVWVYLLSNAVKFSSNHEKPVISVTCTLENNNNIYCIRDNGVGFNMQYKDKLFGVFQRLHSVKDFEGTGVGLAIVKRIVHRHGGRVWAEGEVNKGAAFYFTLPVK